MIKIAGDFLLGFMWQVSGSQFCFIIPVTQLPAGCEAPAGFLKFCANPAGENYLPGCGSINQIKLNSIKLINPAPKITKTGVNLVLNLNKINNDIAKRTTVNKSVIVVLKS